MSEGKLRKAEKKGFNFTAFERNQGKAGVKVWMCKCPNFVSVAKSPCGLGTTQEAAYDDCVEHMKAKKTNEKAQPSKKKAAPAK